MPLPSGAELDSAGRLAVTDGVEYDLTYTASGSPKAVVDRYDQELQAGGFTEKNTISGSNGAISELWSTASLGVQVQAVPAPGNADISGLEVVVSTASPSS